MKLKRLPEDFQVQELTELQPSGGAFGFYRLTKQSLGTLEAVAAIAQRWKIDPRRIAFGGLKDKHARTVQFLTIHRGPARGLRQTRFELKFLGRVPRAFAAKDICGNRFEITIRDLTAAQLGQSLAGLAEVRRDGLPNYFDNQRFGSVGASGEFIAAPWCRGNFERALWLALADPQPGDRAGDRKEKSILREHWGDWNTARDALPRGQRKSIVSYLAGRAARGASDFRGAFARINAARRGLYLAALQSHLWNCVLAELLRRTCAADQRLDLPLRLGLFPFPRGLNDEQRRQLREIRLPLPSARLHLPPGPMLDLVTHTLAAEGWQLRELRAKYPRDSFFSKGERAALVHPAELRHQAARDELYAGRDKLTLSFELPRGSYATLVCKRICSPTAALPQEFMEETEEPGDDWQ